MLVVAMSAKLDLGRDHDRQREIERYLSPGEKLLLRRPGSDTHSAPLRPLGADESQWWGHGCSNGELRRFPGSVMQACEDGPVWHQSRFDC